MTRVKRWVAALATGTLVLPLLLASPDAARADSPLERGTFQVKAESNTKPEFVSGGDVLVRVAPSGSLAAEDLVVELNGEDVTEAFAAQNDGTFLGLVTGLREGENALVARGPGFRDGSLDIRNYPIVGPVFSGPQQLPFFCETESFGLEPAVQPFCAAPTEVSYTYQSTDGDTKPLSDPTVLPDDVATTTVNGVEVPYVTRLETGTINRGIYQIAALHDGSEPSPLRSSRSRNGRLVYTFGGGCNVGFHQGSTIASVGGYVGDGYIVASSTLNVFENNCNAVISAETMMMVKEHAIETYGPVAWTMGEGGSGGAIQQHEIADMYPGILDGLLMSSSFPDALSLATVGDCRLMDAYFGEADGFTVDQQELVSGFKSYGSCQSWGAGFGTRLVADLACPAAIPPEYLYSQSNPGGVKCTVAEQVVNQLGRDPVTGFARGFYDNTGVQYGLEALQSGAITPEQFVDLNERIGGFDVAGNYAAERTAADPLGVQRAYRSGLVLDGGGGLGGVPIIDARNYRDDTPDIHTDFWSSVVRERLIAANGDAANHVVFTYFDAQEDIAFGDAFTSMERWLDAIEEDTSSADPHQKVLENRPEDVNDACWTPDGEKVVEPRTYPSEGVCGELFPSFGDTRTAAGGPLANNILDCRQQPLDVSTYGVDVTPDQAARLQTVFPRGVCDWSRPGFGQQPLAGVWQSYATGPDGRVRDIGLFAILRSRSEVPGPGDA